METLPGPEERARTAVPVDWLKEFVHTALLSPSPAYFRLKRAMDVCVSSVALLLLSPLFLLIALMIKMDSPGPVLFVQERVGYDRARRSRKLFPMYKFRTMYHRCDETPHLRLVTDVIRDGDEAGRWRGRTGFLKLTDDPRVTRLGRVLRRTSADELPQLGNVLVGDMSLVGPRPPLPYEVAAYQPHHMRRLEAVPGCSGLWQVSGWNRLTFEEMVRLDVEYIEHQSLWLDVRIVLRTASAILSSKGGG